MIGLLDTHSFLWAVAAPDKLSAKMRGVIADPGNEIHVSTVSFWKIALKCSLGKLQIAQIGEITTRFGTSLSVFNLY